MRGLVLLMLLFAGDAAAQMPRANNQAAEKKANWYWVFFRDKGATRDSDEIDRPVATKYLDSLRALGAEVRTTLRWENAALVCSSDITALSIGKTAFVEDIRAARSVSHTLQRPDTLVLRDSSCSQHPFDSAYGPNRFALKALHVPEFHRMGIDATGVKIGFADTGFRTSIAPLANRKIIHQYDYVFGDTVVANEANDVPGQDSHGTAVLTLAAGFELDSNIGPAFNAELLLAKTEDLRSESPVEEANYAKALEDFTALGVDIFSSSLGYFYFDSGFVSHTYADLDGRTTIAARAAAEAARRGVLVLTAAGNSGTTEHPFIMTPADADSIITVGAISPNDTIAAFSSRGPTPDGRIKPDVTAPGTDLFVPTTDGLHFYGGGTSYATPLVAGSAALIMQAHPEADAQEIRRAMIQNGDHFTNPDSANGYGKLNAFAAAKSLGAFIAPPRAIETWDSLYLCVAAASNLPITSVWIEYGLNDDATLNHFLPLGPLSTSQDSGFYSAGIRRPLGSMRFVVRLLESGADTITNFPRKAPEYKLEFPVRAVARFEKQASLQVYPNPARSEITVRLPVSADGTVTLINEAGMVVQVIPVRKQPSVSIDIRALAAGAYLVQFDDGRTRALAPIVIWR